MMTLDQIKKRAQQTANRDGKPCVIYNFNRVGVPLYVIREDCDGAENRPEFVARIQPE